MNKQRTEDYKSGNYALADGVVDPLPEDAPQVRTWVKTEPLPKHSTLKLFS